MGLVEEIGAGARMVVGPERIGVGPVAGAQQRSITDRVPGRAVIGEPVRSVRIGLDEAPERGLAREPRDGEEQADREQMGYSGRDACSSA